MAKKKYYGVYKGFIPGVYDNWDECNAQVSGFSGAIFKGFSTRSEAELFAEHGVSESVSEKPAPVKSRSQAAGKADPDFDTSKPYAFVDGSFNPSTGVFGYGGFVCFEGQRVPVMGSGDDVELASMRNVAGEIYGAMAAVKTAEAHGIRELTMLYDYRGIEEWANGAWKTNKAGTKAYKEFMQSDDRRVSVTFQKVPAHTGIEGNEMADVMAKHAVGIDLTRSQQALFNEVFASASLPEVEAGLEL